LSQLCSLLLIALLAKFPAEAGPCPPTTSEKTRQKFLNERDSYYSNVLSGDITSNDYNANTVEIHLSSWMNMARDNQKDALTAFHNMYVNAHLNFNKGFEFMDILAWIVGISGIDAGRVWKNIVDSVVALTTAASELMDGIESDFSRSTTWQAASHQYLKHLNDQNEFKQYLITKFMGQWRNKGDRGALSTMHKFTTKLYREHCPSKRAAFNMYYNHFQVTWLSEKAQGKRMMPRHVLMDDKMPLRRKTRFLWSPAPPGVNAKTVARRVFEMNEKCIDGDLLPLNTPGKFIPRIMTLRTDGWWFEFPSCGSLNNHSHQYSNGREQRRVSYGDAVNPTPFCDHARFALGNWHYKESDLKTIPMHAWNYKDNWLTPSGRGGLVY